MLDTQYRMEPHIAAFLSKHMYMKKLKSAEGLYEQRKKICEKQPAKNMPISIADTTGMLTSFHRTISGSYFNILTAFCSVFLAQKPAESFDVGIITPYREQAKLISSIIKDILETGKNVKIISSTVHSFQGSEQDIIIYDAPDCYIRPYPTQLLSDNKNQIADRLFNVAMSRAKGKFIALMNYDYLKGHLSKERLFSKFFVQQKQHKNEILNEQIFNTDKNVCLRKFNEEEAEQRFINDIKNAQKNISVYIPGIFTTDWKRIIKELNNNNKVRVSIFIEERLVSEIKKNNFESNIEISSKKVIMNPITIIDNLIIWYGKPITRTDFISQKNDCHVYYRPIFRFEGDNTAKKIKALLQN